MADENLPNPEPFPKDVIDELLGRGPSVVEGKRDQDEGVDPKVGNVPDLLFRGGDEVEGPPLRMKDHLGMGLEADHHGRALVPMRLFYEMAENMLMAEVDAVEVADGDDGAPQTGGDIFAAPDHVHEFPLTSLIHVAT